MGNNAQTLWMFRSAYTITSGFEELPISQVQFNHDPSLDQDIGYAKTWRTQYLDGSVSSDSFFFSAYRPFIEPQNYLDLSL
jgi:hypothetical protein